MQYFVYDGIKLCYNTGELFTTNVEIDYETADSI